MIIKVNKTQQEINFKKDVWTIIEIAKQKAGVGIDAFRYPIKKGLGYNFNDLIDAVEHKTNDSVYGNYNKGMIKFRIR